MRILVVTNLYPPVTVGGYETCCGLVCERLRERHELTVLTSDRRADEVAPEPWIIRTLPLFHGVSGDTLTAAAVTRRAIARTREALHGADPELIYVWAGSGIPKGAIRVLETAGRPLAFSVLDWWLDRPYAFDPFTRYLGPGPHGRRGAWATVSKLANHAPGLRVELRGRTPAAINWCSETTRSLTTLPPTLEPALERVVPLATVHEDGFAAVRRIEAEPGTARILFIGRVSAEKGADVAVRALSELRRTHGIDSELVLCGPVDDAMRSELEALARSAGVGEHVALLGTRDREGLGAELARASALVVPSIWQEPFGLTPIEGALARVPLVVSRSGGLAETMREEQDALFFDISDHAGAADALARTLRDPAATAARVDRARRRAETFSVARYLDASEAFVDDAIAALARAPVVARAR